MKTLIPKHKPLTMQQAFDRSLKWMRSGRGQCRSKTKGCLYRNHSWTNACGVGCLLSDDAIKKCVYSNGKKAHLDGQWHDALYNFPFLAKEFVQSKNINILLTDIQNCHDDDMYTSFGNDDSEASSWKGKEFTAKGEARMKDIASHYKLKYTKPKAVSKKK